jgi:histidinol dehydrogenase
MDRTFFAFVLCSLSTLHASEPYLNSPTQNYQNNLKRVSQRIQDAQSEKAEIKGQLALLDYSNHHDSYKPDSERLAEFQLRKEALSAQYSHALTNLRRKIKRLKREEQRLTSIAD